MKRSEGEVTKAGRRRLRKDVGGIIGGGVRTHLLTKET